jgi:hypothetical protein
MQIGFYENKCSNYCSQLHAHLQRNETVAVHLFTLLFLILITFLFLIQSLLIFAWRPAILTEFCVCVFLLRSCSLQQCTSLP